ncbi:pilus assembly protein PilZ [Flavisphingomonas formosensis]|uniref:pilus assembly protein PilZ n=1 Tax=Flavisphingomonas formosensis TaxID=861534 RepID=UPI0012FCA077|nr:pilus assembly protein PilZ [Sphingomonas formosensis]
MDHAADLSRPGSGSGSSQPPEIRRAARAEVRFVASLRRRGGRAGDVTIVDISTIGFRAETASVFHTGTQLWLKLPGLDAILTRVAWTSNVHIGCEFMQPLHIAVFDRIVAIAHAQAG